MTAEPKRELMSESQFMKEILKAFKDDDNVKIFRRNCGGMKDKNGQYVKFGEAGQADLWGIIASYRCYFCNRLCQGVHFEIELKSEKGELTDKQVEWLQMVGEYNGIALVLRPIETDPVNLRSRIWRLLERKLCPTCYANSKLNP